jgi:hypothetical protein
MEVLTRLDRKRLVILTEYLVNGGDFFGIPNRMYDGLIAEQPVIQ